MTKKELEKQLNEVERRLRKLEKMHEVVAHTRDYLSIEQAKKRDYIVRTDYLGKITHKKLKEDFKKELETTICDIFSSISNKILNYEFYDEEQHIQILEEFYRILKDYEKKQLVIDTYGNKECK